MTSLSIDKNKLPDIHPAPLDVGTDVPKTTLRGQLAKGLLRQSLAKEIEMHRKLGHRGIPGLRFQDLNMDGPVTPNNLPRLAPRVGAADPAVDGVACIIGAGAAGLYTAMMLDSVGMPYVIYESDSRVGGRAYTYQFPEGRPTEYVDFGAMRFPKIDSMTRVFKLMNSPEIAVPLTKYDMNDPMQPSLFNDIQCIETDNTPADPFKVGVSNGGTVQDIVANIQINSLLTNTLGYFFLPYLQELNTDFASGSKKLIEDQSLDQYSTREWLAQQSLPSATPGGSATPMGWDTVQWLETQDTSTNLFDEAVIESIIDYFDFNYNPIAHWWCVQGGTSVFTDKMCATLQTQPTRNTRISSVTIDSTVSGDANMTVSGIALPENPTSQQPVVLGSYNAVFNTTTLSCLQRMDLTGVGLSYEQKVAIRSLHYDVSAKVAIRFSCAWWRKYCGITQGGTASTDLPLRTCVYPSYNLEDSVDDSATIIVSYTWAQDAQRMGSLIGADDQQLLDTIYADLVALHKNSNISVANLKTWTLAYKSWDWSHCPNTSGAFALFGPGQFSTLYPCLTKPAANGKFYFTGEATSAHHAWIVGAFNSAYRSVLQYLLNYGQLEKHAKLIADPLFGGVDGTVLHDEIETGEHGFLHLQVLLSKLPKHEQLNTRSLH